MSSYALAVHWVSINVFFIAVGITFNIDVCFSEIRRTLAKVGRKPKSYFDANHTIQRLNKSKSKASMGVNYNEHRYSADYSEESGARGSRHPSPEPGYTMAMCERFAKERRKRENSYDIDNIIIPRSYSSAARVEILNYKEIPTPKYGVFQILFFLLISLTFC